MASSPAILLAMVELAVLYFNDIHRLHRLMVARPNGLSALRRVPGQTFQRGADRVGVCCTRSFDSRLVGEQQTIAVGTVQVRISTVPLAECLSKGFILRGVDKHGIPNAGNEPFGRSTDRIDVLRCHGTRCAKDGEAIANAEIIHLCEQTHGVIAGDRCIEDIGTCRTQLTEILRIVL